MSRDDRVQRVLLLGADHSDFGQVHEEALDHGRTVCSISAGADPLSPSMRSKGDPDDPNEDALLAFELGDRLFLAVADAHFGVEASHSVIRALGEIEEIPSDVERLQEILADVPTRVEPGGLSATTLLVAVLDRRARSGFGVSFGDSSIFLIGEGGARPLNTRHAMFVRPWEPADLETSRGLPFRFRTGARQLLVAFTDGIDECHYRSPATSVRPRHLEGLFAETGPDPGGFNRGLMELALEGVGGHPGGQDNVALLVSRTDAS